jgi:Mg-chelatase subunit ChlD
MSRKSALLCVALAGTLAGCDRPPEGAMPTSGHDVATATNTATAAPHTAKRATWPPLEEGSATASALPTINYYLVLDASGSMLSHKCGGGTSKIDAALAAVKHFIAAVPADTNVGLAAFDRRAISERVPLGVGNRDSLYAALKNIVAGSDTPLRSSIKIGYDKLTAQARTQLGYGEYHLVVVTDGNPDPPNEDPTTTVNEILAKSPVVLHTIGFCIDSNHVLNQPNRTYYASATNPEELQAGLQAVMAEAPTFDAAQFSK